jgi:hypothetical protein
MAPIRRVAEGEIPGCKPGSRIEGVDDERVLVRLQSRPLS